jgi:copper chaperone CopZ
VVSCAERPRVLSLIPGRIRVHLPGWTGCDGERIENCLRRVNGVASVQANALTGNVLVYFDPLTTEESKLLAELGKALEELPNGERAADAGCPPLRVVVRGLLGHAVVDSLWFVGSSVGLPLAGLGRLHVLMDIAVWTMALAGEQTHR